MDRLLPTARKPRRDSQTGFFRLLTWEGLL